MTVTVPMVWLALGACPAILGAAGSVPRLSLDELIAQSDTIVEGTVTRAWAAMDSENRFIWTHYEVRVKSVVKGQPGETVVIGEPGGTLGGITMLAPGSTEYAIGEHVGVFLYRTPIGYLRTTNYGQGKISISAWGELQSRVLRIISAQKGGHR